MLEKKRLLRSGKTEEDSSKVKSRAVHLIFPVTCLMVETAGIEKAPPPLQSTVIRLRMRHYVVSEHGGVVGGGVYRSLE